MSIEEAPEAPAQERRPSNRWDRAEQAAHWRDIGISAVAAAARYASDKTPVSDAPATGAARAGKTDGVVTLRDIEYFAA